MRALISVSDKKGIVAFAGGLVKLGYSLISTGGTLQVLKENHVPVIPVEEVTNSPEILDGRVKTLHPKIHGGILAKRDNAEHMRICQEHLIGLIDLVVVNLYPFEHTISKAKTTLDEAIENIDVGGPTMVRAAAKNYSDVGIVVNPERYDSLLEEMEKHNGRLTDETRAHLACEAFEHTARYDSIIATYLKRHLTKTHEEFPPALSPIMTKVTDLRYGENPHQRAAFYRSGEYGIPSLRQVHGKELSYNNIIDIEAAWQLVREYEIPGAVVIKHTNPCGAATGASLPDAYLKAYEADPVSAFGSIVGLNRPVDQKTAELISQTFVEAVIAPSFDNEALAILVKKPAIRILETPLFNKTSGEYTFRYVEGGVLIQTPDHAMITKDDLEVKTTEKPNQHQINDLLFAYTTVKHVKSNAIVVAKDGRVLGIGAGQMSRVESVEIALKKAGKEANGAVLASDAFFPFKDSVELAVKAGIKVIVQPGGSKRDQESIDCCNEYGISMVFTGIRHFKH